MKRLHELFGFSFYISGFITYVVGVSWMIYIAWIFFFLYAFSTVFLIYSHKQETGSYKKAFKKYSGELFVMLFPFIAWIMTIIIDA
ncbi:hypothetical protein [Leyella stercorea]|uniref:hypothetical protein n=1 Tax=Leyella stercorea TaxID=363265 RepID=UPI00266CC77B|nr:hypothetical protein [Leyella stercorea]